MSPGASTRTWRPRMLSDVVSLQRGHDLTWRQRRPGSVPVMGSAGVNGTHDRALAPGPGVVLGRSGASFGTAHYVDRDYWPHNTALYVTDFHGNDPRYVFYLLSSIDFSRHNSGGAQQSLNRNFIASIELDVPEYDEQCRIAAALDDASDRIAAIEVSIAKKQAVKQGMMQQLLTGRTRLPGFAGDWRESSVGELAAVDPEVLPAGTPPAVRINYISLEDVSRGELLGSTELAFGDSPSRARRVVKTRDVLFGTVRPNLQSHLLYAGGLRNPVASTGFAVVRASVDADPGFLFELLMSDMTATQIERIIAGSNYPAVSSGDVRKLVFMVPKADEQRAISAVLSDAEREIGRLRSRLAKARAIKTGMMQQLLTGRVRLPVEAAS
ncbi:MAG TPA: restriction endonuclease subunit S [Dermatophilaceae bacterium]|nr:restriction endonuclease subunit S [Dermatophilaceae bacterium]